MGVPQSTIASPANPINLSLMFAVMPLDLPESETVPDAATKRQRFAETFIAKPF
jgi:hypothetical protein